MGKLARTCRFLADGRRVDESWRQLLNGEFVLRECQSAVHRGDSIELEEAYALLTTESSGRHASSAHQRLFQTDTGADRLEAIRRTIACGHLAICCKQPLSGSAIRELAVWAPRALGIEGVAEPIELSQVETSGTIIDRVINTIDGVPEASRQRALATTRQFSGIRPGALHSLKIPIALVDRITDAARMVWLHLHKIDHGSGLIYPSPLAALSLEVAEDTKQGIALAWQYARERNSANDVDVHWWIEGSDSISGRSADAAFTVGLMLLLRDAPYDTQCVISAAVTEGGNLAPVGGINDAGNPKLEAARSLSIGAESIKVVVATANALSAEELMIWRGKGIEVATCQKIDEALQQAGQQLQRFDAFLSKQITTILRQASTRFDREIATTADFSKLIVPMRVARGIRQVLTDEEKADLSASDGSDEERDEITRQVLDWHEFVDQCKSRAVVLADPGFGKTTLLWQLAANECEQARQTLRSKNASLANSTFAVFLPAAKLASAIEETDTPRSETPILECIESVYSLDPQLQGVVAEKILNGRCLICLDALDEVSDSRDLKSFLSHTLHEHPLVRVVLTSRLSGYSGPPFDVEQESQAELLPLAVRQIRQAIEAWFGSDPELASTMWRQIARNQRLHDVFCSPLLLQLASQQIRIALDAKQPLPTWGRRVDLYEGFVTHALQQLADRTDEPIKEMEQFEFRLFLGEFARGLWERDASRTLWPRDALRKEAKASVDRGQFWGLKKRFHQLFDDLQDSGILVPVTAGDSDSPIMFLHRTIGEYLAGNQMANAINEAADDCWLLVEKKCWDPAWEQVLLFCAGSMKEPQALLDRLRSDAPTLDNPHGDDILKHRLMLGAQCLRELELSSTEKHASEITTGVLELFKQIPEIIEISASVNALQSLLAINDEGGRNLKRTLHERIPHVEQVLPKVGAIAYSEDVFLWLTNQLWNACRTERSGQTRLPLLPLATAIVAICDEIDIERIVKLGHDDEAAMWRVIGAILRAAKNERSKTVRLSTKLLDSIGDALSGAQPSIGLRQTIDALPIVEPDVLENSSLLEKCRFVIATSDSEEVLKRCFQLLKSLGAIAGKNQSLASMFSRLEFNGPHRAVIEAVVAMRRSLATAEFVSTLESAIETADPSRAGLGVDMFFALNAYQFPEWIDGVKRLAGRRQSAGRLFELQMKHDASLPLVRLTCKLLTTDEHRPLAIRAVGSFVASLEEFELRPQGYLLAERLRWLDALVTALVQENSLAAFDAPELLNRVRTSSELSVRLLFEPLVRLACRYRSSDRLVDWIVTFVRSTGSEIDESFLRISEALIYLAPDSKQYLRVAVQEAGLQSKAKLYLRLAQAIYGSTRDLLDCVVDYFDTGATSQHSIAAAILDDFTLGTVDERLVGKSLAMLRSPRPARRMLASRALCNLTDSAVTPQLAKQLIRALDRETTPGELTATIGTLARRNPNCFASEVQDLFFDRESPLQEHATCILPHLGNRLVDSERFPLLREQLRSRDRNRRMEASLVLSRAMQYCDDQHRTKLLAALSRLDDESIYSRLDAFDEPTEDLVAWLLQQLADEDARLVQTAIRLLLQLGGSNSKIGREPLLSRVSLTEGIPIRIRLPGADVEPIARAIERIAVGCERQRYRLFSVGSAFVEGMNVADLSN